MNSFIVALAEKCIGCHTCEVACAVAHAGSPVQAAQHYFPRLRVVKDNRISVPVMCRQCDNAPCVAACPVAALRKGEQAIEVVDGRCIDCKSCMVACPFGAIDIVSSSACLTAPEVVKCDLCSEQASGPTCVKVCPTGALSLVTPAGLSHQRQKKQQQTARESQHIGPFLNEVNHG